VVPAVTDTHARSAATPAATSSLTAGSAADGPDHEQWTRESIITELASWMLGRKTVDAGLVRRYGPPGLVAAAIRVFGHFDVALNVAGQHVEKLYPDRPPES